MSTRHQNKRVKRNARSFEAVTSPTNSEHDDIDDDSYDGIDILNPDLAKKVNTTNKKRARATREPTSFVWGYFKRGEDLISATCKVIKDDGEECGHNYTDGSTTSNLIHHLATKHKIFKPGSAEEVNLRFYKVFF